MLSVLVTYLSKIIYRGNCFSNWITLYFPESFISCNLLLLINNFKFRNMSRQEIQSTYSHETNKKAANFPILEKTFQQTDRVGKKKEKLSVRIRGSGEELQLHSFLTLILDKNQQSALRHDHLRTLKETSVHSVKTGSVPEQVWTSCHLNTVLPYYHE